MSYEHNRAEMEASQSESLEEYFNARPKLSILQNERIFEAGFQRAWSRREAENAKLREEVAVANRLLLDMTGKYEAAEAKLAGCTRSHPHENMTKTCELSTEIARLTNHLATAEAKLKAVSERTTDGILVECIAGAISRHITQPIVQREVIEAAQYIAQRYAAPIPPADVQGDKEYIKLLQQQRVKHEERIAELERKLAEQQGQNNFDATRLRCLASKCGVAVPESDEELLGVAGVVLGSIRRAVDRLYSKGEELNTLLAQAREEGRKEAVPKGWQAVPKEIDKNMRNAFFNCVALEYRAAESYWDELLAAAPTPGEKE